MSPERRKVIIWTNAGLLSIGTLGTNFSSILNRNSNIFEDNAIENVVWKMVAIFSRPQCVSLQVLIPYTRHNLTNDTEVTEAFYFTLFQDFISFVYLHWADYSGSAFLSITMTSKWSRWRLKSPTSRLFAQSFFGGKIKEKKLRVTGLFEGNPLVTGGLPSQ